MEIHTGLEALGKILGGPSAAVIDIELGWEGGEPVEGLLAVFQGFGAGDHVLQHDIALAVELVAPVAVGGARIGIKRGGHCLSLFDASELLQE